METPGYIALSRQSALRQQMSVLANNLANMETPSFKAESLLFAEYVAEAGETGPRGLRKLSMVQDLATVRDVSQGRLATTGNSLDFAISGEGFFVVETEAGERYTRNGAFVLDPDGRIVTGAGDPVVTEGGQPITIPPGSSSIEVSRDGTISVDDPGNPDSEILLGRLQVVSFANPQRLKTEAGGLMRAENAAAEPVEEVEILQGMVERSNVQGVVEMTKLIDTVRSYESATRLIQQEHERQRQAIQVLAGGGGQA